MYNDVYPLVSSNVAIGNPLQMEASIGKSPVTWVFSIAMFDYRRLIYWEAVKIPVRLCQHSHKILGELLGFTMVLYMGLKGWSWDNIGILMDILSGSLT